jgi:formamidopyrimidine-DNA glycosylase
MPEIPDLNIFGENVFKKFRNKRVEKIKVLETKRIKTPVSKFQKAVAGQRLIDIYRDGKELRFLFENGNVIGLHLMLHGNIEPFEKKNEHKFTVAELWFDDKTGLAISDWQRNAMIYLNPEKKEAPDVLSKDFTYKYLKEKLSKSKANIKAFIRDQDIMRDIGNAYSDEILYDAKISPYSIANAIPEGKIKQLIKSIKKVLAYAEKHIKKTHPGIMSGEVRDFLKVHNSRKKESPAGFPIKRKAVGASKTYYTDEQLLYK